MYAPVIHRFRTYAIEILPGARHYVEAMTSLPAFQQWTRDALAETLVIERFEAV
jgi:glutathione S-transferase